MRSKVREWLGLNPLRFSGLGMTALATLLTGCASLPSSGPTASRIVQRAEKPGNGLHFRIVGLDGPTVEALNRAQDKRLASAETMASIAEAPRHFTLGPGDVLDVSIFEVGVSLFSAASDGTSSGLFDPSAHGQKFPSIVVDQNGNIALPYVGTIAVTGLTPSDVEALIDKRLSRKSQSPQAVVTLHTNISNTVIVSGDANRPGRYELSYDHERLLDAIAAASGASASAEDTLVRFERNGRIVEQRLGSIRLASADDILLAPSDRIQLIKRPRSFTVFGATPRVTQVSFETGAVTLAEALARVQGPSDAQADATGIFIFRYDDDVDGPGKQPIIYRMNLMDPASYFLAQRFYVQDKDVIYIANARANQPSKFVAIINQLFSPFVAARTVAQ